jgi:hypothetical protein
MPNSSDDPATAPAPSVMSEMPAATVDNSGEEIQLPDPSSPEGPHRLRRRRRRRRGPQPAMRLQNATDADLTQQQDDPSPGDAAQAEQTAARTSGLPPRRRRRRRPPREASQPSAMVGDLEIDQNNPVEGASPASGDATGQSEVSQETAGGVPAGSRRRRRRSRRRGPSGPASSGPTEGGSEPSSEGVSQSIAGGGGGPRTGHPHQRWTSEPRARQDRTRSRGLRPVRDEGRGRAEASDGQAERKERGLNDRGPREEARRGTGPHDRRSRGGPLGRGRQAPSKKPEQKLYALESVVDRGFEDISEESGEGGARRVHWTIVKRTVADQKSGKPMSAAYVLQRDGVEAEYPNLGAARAAVNKTIVHPEKLTLSKAEHVAAKASR